MTGHRVFALSFAKLYPLYLTKAAKKGRSQAEVDTVIQWLTGYSPDDMARILTEETPLQAFFAHAPTMHPNRDQITGQICGIRVETIEDPTMKAIRQLDKLIDELAKGRRMEKILRA